MQKRKENEIQNEWMIKKEIESQYTSETKNISPLSSDSRKRKRSPKKTETMGSSSIQAPL